MQNERETSIDEQKKQAKTKRKDMQSVNETKAAVAYSAGHKSN